MEKVEDYPRRQVKETRDLSDRVRGLPLSQVIANLTEVLADGDRTVEVEYGPSRSDFGVEGRIFLSWHRDETDEEYHERAQRTLNNRANKTKRKENKRRREEGLLSERPLYYDGERFLYEVVPYGVFVDQTVQPEFIRNTEERE